MRHLIEAIYRLRIFLSPNFAVGLIIAILYSISGFSYWYLILFIPSIIIGVLLAERARKKYEASNHHFATRSNETVKHETVKQLRLFAGTQMASLLYISILNL